MNKKGFTLAEVLGVITILGLLGLIIFPTIDKALKEGKKELYNIQIDNIESGADAWVAENLFSVPDGEGEILTITLGQLKQSGKVAYDIKNPITKILFPDDMIITITKTNNRYDCEVIEDSGTPGTLTEYNEEAPTIVLNGGILEYVELKTSGSDYVDLGVIAKNHLGEIIANVTTVISDGTNTVTSIPITTIGSYNVSYSATYEGITTTVIRTVIVKDSEAPIITIPTTTTVTSALATSYNLISTITVSDVSTYTVVADRNLTAVAGTYTINYTATDAYNNVSTARRTIIVQ